MRGHFFHIKCKFYFVFLVFAVFTFFITTYLSVPNRIKIVEGNESSILVPFPAYAQVEKDSISVFQISSQKVKDNISIDLQEEYTLAGLQAGTGEFILNALGLSKTVQVDVLPGERLIPCGMTVGVRINTEGVLVLGIGYVNNEEGQAVKPCDGILKSGDLILTANDEEIENQKHLIRIIEDSEGDIALTIKRDEEKIALSVTPIVSMEDGLRKIGCWVRDSTKGIGTITYYNPATGSFGALGHGIVDVDTKELMSIRTGEISESEVVSVKKGKKGAPGELIGSSNGHNIGTVTTNTDLGIYGIMDSDFQSMLDHDTVEIATQESIHEGPATILSNIEGTDVKEYDIYIESVNRNSNDESKGMVIRITDPDLLQKTSGIVQGMSGSPILQDGRLIGAVTHVFVQNPAKGYGIFIENMLKEEMEGQV